MFSDELLKKYPIVSDQVDQSELGVILRELETRLQAGDLGSVVEFGCYVGTTSLFIERLLQKYGREHVFYVYDSFTGLPEKATQDLSPAGEQFRPGELAATKQQFVTNFKKAGLPLPVITKGWFNELPDASVPDDIMFAFLDGDYYGSIKSSLQLIEPKLTKNAVIIIDDYANEALPGAAKATDEWLKLHPYSCRVQSSLAVLRP